METRKDLFEKMSAAFGPLAAEIICRATAGVRHQERIAATIQAAKDFCGGWGGNPTELAGILSLEVGGVGGRFDSDGAATARHPAFAGLGSGRKQAHDGAAYFSAAQSTLEEVKEGRQVSVCLKNKRVMIQLGDEQDKAILLQCCGPVRWIRAEATRAALKAAGIDGWNSTMQWDAKAIEVALYECDQMDKDHRAEEWWQAAEINAPKEKAAYCNAVGEKDDAAELAALEEKMVSLGFGYMPEPGEWPE